MTNLPPPFRFPSVLLCLAVQAGDFSKARQAVGAEEVSQKEELEALWTNVKVLLAGLDAYGQMWDGIGLMGGESINP